MFRLINKLLGRPEECKKIQYFFSKEREPSEYDISWNATGWFRTRTWRSTELGLSYLDWESQLIMDESWGLSKDDPNYGKPSQQAIKAQEISELYHWWKFTRPNRPDPYEVSGWTEYCEEKRGKGDSLWDFMSENETEDEKQQSRKMIDLMNKIEEDYYKEDEEMLIKLIRLRRSLWT